MATTPETLWEVRRIPNKGYGVVATAPIEPGTRLLMEKPLYTRPMTDDPIKQQNSIVESLIQNLPDPAQRDAFHALASSFSVLYPDYPYYSIATTNEVALAYWAWHDDHTSPEGKGGVLTVHAIRHLNPGDEIHISYFENRVMAHDDRERYLAEVYCFACDCALCSLAPGPWRDDVDERLRQLEAFWRKYHLGESDGPPLSPSSSSFTSSPVTADAGATTTTIAASLPSDEPASDVPSTGGGQDNDEGATAAVVDVKSLNQRRFLHDPFVCFAECREAAELILEAQEDVGDGVGGGGRGHRGLHRRDVRVRDRAGAHAALGRRGAGLRLRGPQPGPVHRHARRRQRAGGAGGALRAEPLRRSDPFACP
ncbi:hypothetical protein PG993_012221 [Apiospora rasikravindrae]|uniref:SET domain-containing protein n=1 Tax=Apiospora rasikravindrae TaxID=990691 RepID=A0ABR1S3A0_9PEZI